MPMQKGCLIGFHMLVGGSDVIRKRASGAVLSTRFGGEILMMLQGRHESGITWRFRVVITRPYPVLKTQT